MADEEDLGAIKDACLQTFSARHQQTWPPRVTIYSSWAERYATMATGLAIPITDVNEAAQTVHDFVRRIDENS